MSRVAMSESDFDTGSELSDLEFLGMLVKEYVASAPVVAMNRDGGFVGFIWVLVFVSQDFLLYNSTTMEDKNLIFFTRQIGFSVR